MRSPEEQAEKLKAYLTRVAQGEGTTVSDEQLTYWTELLIEDSTRDPARELEEACRWYEKVAKSGATFLADLEAAPSDALFEDFSGVSRERLEATVRHVTLTASELATPAEPKRGRKAMGDARAVARTAYFVFLGVAEREPMITLERVAQPGILYLEFLSEIFRVLQIDASPEHFTKVVINDIRSERAAGEKERWQPD